MELKECPTEEEIHVTTNLRDVQHLDYEGNADHNAMRDYISFTRLAEFRNYDRLKSRRICGSTSSHIHT